MSTPTHAIRHVEIFAALAAPFEPREVRTRQQGGRDLSYITARTAMNRLDNVIGPADWWDEYEPHENSVLCRLSIRLPDGTILTKSDAGGHAGMSDTGDDEKSGYSDAFKRACVKLGIGRYLYRDGVPAYVSHASPANGHAQHEPEPRRPAREPGDDSYQETAPRQSQSRSGGNGNGNGQGVPRSGKALFAWTKDQEQKYEVGLLQFLNNWAKLQEFPSRMVEWDAEQVALAHAEAVRKLQSLASNRQAG